VEIDNGDFYCNLSRIPKFGLISEKKLPGTVHEDLSVFHIVYSNICSIQIHNTLLCFHGKAVNIYYVVDNNVCTSIHTECNVVLLVQQRSRYRPIRTSPNLLFLLHVRYALTNSLST
jgi:hypothetical protein